MLALDTETTGIDVFNDRVVTCSLIYDDGNGRQVERNYLIDPGVEIPEGASNVHGITNEIARAAGMSPDQGLRDIASSMAVMMDAGVPLVIYNAPYDITLLQSEFKRYGINYDRPFDRVIDPYVIDKAVDKYRKGKRILVETAKLYGFNLVNAHSADADNKASLFLARFLLNKHFEDSTTIEELQELQKEWKVEQSASLQKYFRKTDPDVTINGEWPFQTRAA
jgi:DNA polymerase-3 subunit epsilon